jgi:hypothetical protein
MEKTLERETTTQFLGLPSTSPGIHRPDGTKANIAITVKLDRLGLADRGSQFAEQRIPYRCTQSKLGR